MDTVKRAMDVCDQTYVMSLAVVDGDRPWVADVIFVHDEDLNIYWMSRTTRYHSKIIDQGNGRVAVTITATQRPQEKDFGLQISGIARRLEESPKGLLKKWMKKKKKPVASAIGAVLTDHHWYQLVPERIELIDEEHFGYDRQTIR